MHVHPDMDACVCSCLPCMHKQKWQSCQNEHYMHALISVLNYALTNSHACHTFMHGTHGMHGMTWHVCFIVHICITNACNAKCMKYMTCIIWFKCIIFNVHEMQALSHASHMTCQAWHCVICVSYISRTKQQMRDACLKACISSKWCKSSMSCMDALYNTLDVLESWTALGMSFIVHNMHDIYVIKFMQGFACIMKELMQAFYLYVKQDIHVHTMHGIVNYMHASCMSCTISVMNYACYEACFSCNWLYHAL